MSNALAIAATTATMRNLLLQQVPLIDTQLADLEVTTQPLDQARKTVTKAQLNLFLYQTTVNAAWRNQDVPGLVRPGETGMAPLAIDLHYLLTAYGRADSDNDAVSQRVLGAAMGLLNDHALLGAAEIADAMMGNDLGAQIDRVRITLQPISVDDMSKIWTMAQAPYRASVAYQVGVLLIDSRLPVRSPLPVLKRGADDRGATAVAGLAPVLRQLELPKSQPSLRLGEDAVIVGDNLTQDDSAAAFASPLLDEPIVLPLASTGTPGKLGVHVPAVPEDADALARWHPGFLLLTLVQSRAGVPPISSNALSIALAPAITLAPLAAAVGDIALTVTCAPRLRDGQRAILLFGDRQIAPDAVDTPADAAQPSTLTFTVPTVAAGRYVVRLRVDGVDSIPVVATGTPPLPAFDPAQTVVVS